MTDKKKHIDLFEETIRILSLKKRFCADFMEGFVDSVEKTYIPDNDKTKNLFEDLEAYYKSQKPRRRYSFLLWVLLLSVILIGIVILVPKNQYEKSKPEATQPKEKPADSFNEKEIFFEKPIQIDSLNVEKKGKSKITLAEIKNIDSVDLELQKLRIRALLNDTILEKLPITAASNENVKSDSIVFPEKKNCILPENYTIQFSKKSVEIETIYNDDLIEIATKIKNCPNIETIKIKTYYTRRFLLFSNKKLSSARLAGIIKNLKRNGVTIKMLRNQDTEFIFIQKNEYSGSFEKVEILLDF